MMKHKINEAFSGIFSRFGKKTTTIIVLVGFLGIALLFFSGQTKQTEPKNKEVVTTAQTTQQYVAELENKVKQIVTAVTGDENCIVAVTLENGTEYVYANQTTVNTDRTEDNDSEQTKTKESEKNEQEYIIMKSENGTEQPLTVTEKMPTVRGVAVVSSNISEQTAAQIKESVSAVLNLSARRISIAEKSISQ